MTKKIKIYLSLVLCLAGILFFNHAFAQQALPAGGSSFETAVLLSPEKYQGGPLEGRQELYYSVQVKAGQKINVEAKSFSEAGCSMNLYDEAQEELMSDYATNPKVNWLPNANKSSYKYYVKITNDYADVESFTLEVLLTDYYDANSGTDAGDSFESALNLNTIPGSYVGYFSKALYDIPYIGDDDKDFYRVSLQKGMPYEFKVTPPAESGIALELYDAARQLIDEKESANVGAMVSLFLTPAANANVFLAVKSDLSSAILNYKLDIKSSASIIKFYACDGQYCDTVGEFNSLDACQKSTTKTCYQAENCNDKCGTTSDIIPGPTPGTTTPPASESKPDFIEKLAGLKNLNWLYIGIMAGLVLLAIIVLIFLLRKKPEKKENIPVATFSGSKEADKPVVGYKHPCKYCEKFIPPNSTVCPYCGKINPLGPERCPKCHEIVQKDWQTCSHCGQNLRIVCPKCGKVTFFGDYCEDCGARLIIICPHCGQEQPPISDKCIKCGKKLEKK